jgi:fructokinase
MPSPRVLCLGELLSDPSAAQAVAAVSAGDALANVACALVKLGTPTAWIGNSERGSDRGQGKPPDWLSDLQQAGVSVVELQGDALPKKWFESAQYLVLNLTPLAYSTAVVQQALDWADEFYLKIVVNASWQPSLWSGLEGSMEKVKALMRRSDFLKLSEADAEALLGTTDPLDILRQLEQLEGVCVTSGQRGCSYAFTQGLVGQQAGFVTAVQDIAGAGDSFVAGLVHQLLALGMNELSDGAQVEVLMRYASAAAALTTMKPGAIAAQPTHAEVESFLVGRVD